MDSLQQSDVLLVFTYAPAGLGHLRVTDALYDGLPKEVNSVLLGAEDTKITYWHRLTSLSPFFRGWLEWFTTKKNGYWFYDFFIWTLKITTKDLYRQMENLIKQQWQEKKTVVVVATHFGLAHQIAAMKEKLEKNLKVKIVLVVQVTDATSIEIWYVPGADLIVVPSIKVKTELKQYAKDKGLRRAKIAVLPYPLSLSLQKRLTDKEYENRLRQYSPNSKAKINIVVPISGAAVGLTYYDKLLTKLRWADERFRIFVVVRNNIHTRTFINKMKDRNYVTVIEDHFDKRVIDGYENLYGQEVIGFEIVKPSEQAFKALFLPNQRGGAIMLLNNPVGRQEQDNLDFLIRHKLMANPEDGGKQTGANGWRALRLTNDPDRDVEIIKDGIESGLFEKMGRGKKKKNDPELESNGVEQLWERVEREVKKAKSL